MAAQGAVRRQAGARRPGPAPQSLGQRGCSSSITQTCACRRQEEYTSQSVEGSQREAAGTFTAPFAGAHGWYWKNTGRQPVTVQVSVVGVTAALVPRRAGHLPNQL